MERSVSSHNVIVRGVTPCLKLIFDTTANFHHNANTRLSTGKQMWPSKVLKNLSLFFNAFVLNFVSESVFYRSLNNFRKALLDFFLHEILESSCSVVARA